MQYKMEMKEDLRFLDLWVGTELRHWFSETTGHESWLATANRISEEGYPCECVAIESTVIGLMFENPHYRLAYVLKMKL